MGEDTVEGGGGAEDGVLGLAGGGEGGEDVFDVGAVEAVEEEEGGVELGHEV